MTDPTEPTRPIEPIEPAEPREAGASAQPAEPTRQQAEPTPAAKPINPSPMVRPTCPRHPDRESRLRCQRCGRPTCPECQRPAPVGFHCVDCLRESAATAPNGRHTVVGGVAGGERPTATYVLIAMCVVAFAGQLLVPGLTLAGSFVPILGESQPWRFLTAAFLHSPGMITHILFNMLCLWQVGQWLEPQLGSARFVALYLISALGGSVGYLLLASPPQTMMQLDSRWVTPSVGASGAVFGLFGALLVFLRKLGASVGGLLVLLGINAALPIFYPQIAWQAHLGGFLTGMAVAGLLYATRGRERARYQWPALAGVLVVLVVLAGVKYGVADTGFVDSVYRYV